MKMTVKACRAQVRASANDLAKAVGVSRDTMRFYVFLCGNRQKKILYCFDNRTCTKKLRLPEVSGRRSFFA